MTDRSSADSSTSPSPFQSILANRTHGASALFYQFVQLALEQPSGTVQEGLRACLEIFPQMAVWSYALERITQDESLDEVAADMARQTQATIARGVAALQDYLTVLTLSHSSLVRRTIIACKERVGPVYCAASQPGGEGHLLAESLRQEGVKALVTKDEQATQLIEDVNVVLLGADQYDEGGFINKVGSKRLARRAGELDKPVLVLAEEFKRVTRLPELTPELAELELETEGRVSREIMFEMVPWQSHISLVSNVV